MKRINNIEELQDALMLNKEVYVSLYHWPNSPKLFQQFLNPSTHIDNLIQRVIELKDDNIRGVFQSDTILMKNREYFKII